MHERTPWRRSRQRERVPGWRRGGAEDGEVALEAVHLRQGAGVDVRGGVSVNLVVRGASTMPTRRRRGGRGGELGVGTEVGRAAATGGRRAAAGIRPRT